MRLLPLLALFACLCATPAFAQLHERGISRTGAVQGTTTGGSAFLCRIACTPESGCAGWNWIRAGEQGPQSRCELLAAVTSSTPDSCCDSGLNADFRPVTAGTPVPAGNQYANRSQTPTGPPVELIGDPTGGIWQEAAAEEDTAEDEAAEEQEQEAEAEDDSRFEAMAASEAPEITAPAARITSNVSNGGAADSGTPRYSVQQEYQAPAQALPPS